MARRLFFVDEVRGGRAQMTGEDAHHLTRVLRVERGQKYEISDNCNLYLAEVEHAHQREVSFTVLEKLQMPEQTVHLAAFAALIRLDRFEWIIEKATELGVESIHPLFAERSEKGLEAAARKRLRRWQRIAREASEQSRRARLPEISQPMGIPESTKALDYRYLLDELPRTQPILAAVPPHPKMADRVALCVGPEGGWTRRERESFHDAGWKPVSLGGLILRAETAALSGLAILSAAWQARALP